MGDLNEEDIRELTQITKSRIEWHKNKIEHLRRILKDFDGVGNRQ